LHHNTLDQALNQISIFISDLIHNLSRKRL
jgi:hypothetical protein